MTETNFDTRINDINNLVIKTAVASQYNSNFLDSFDKVVSLIEQKKELIRQEQSLRIFINLQPERIKNLYYDYFTGHYTFWDLTDKYKVSLRQLFIYLKKLKDYTKKCKREKL